MSRLIWIPAKRDKDGWVIEEGHYKCSHCGAEQESPSYTSYCPNCGMRFEKVDNSGD